MNDLEALVLAKPDKLLYHYTSAAGLIGILKERAIWATSNVHLNDRKESKIAERLLKSEADKAHFTPDQNRLFLALVNRAKQNSFVLSFSEEGNRLSQWRAYCPGGAGYAIGFAPSHRVFGNAAGRTFNLVKCVYKEKDQGELAKQLVSRFADYHSNHNSAADLNERNEVFFKRYDWWYLLLNITWAFKHRGFDEEREWRLVCQHPNSLVPHLQYRSGRFGVTPYFALPIAVEDTPIRFDEIVIGPSANRIAAKNALDFLLQTHKCEATKVSISRTPLRQ